MSTWPAPPSLANASASSKSSRSRVILIISLAAIALLVIIAVVGKGMYSNYRRGSAAVDHFHQQLDEAEYGSIYWEASEAFRRAGTQADVTQFLEKVHSKMGRSGNRSSTGFHVNWRGGQTEIDQVFNTQFEFGQARESFVWIVQQDHLRLYGYHVDAPNLR